MNYDILLSMAADVARLRTDMNSAKQSVQDFAHSARSALIGVFGGISAGLILKEIISVSDSMSLMNARLRLVTGSTEDFRAAQEDVFRIAQANNVGLGEAATLYTKLAGPVQRLGGTTKEVAGIVESFALSLRIGGVSASEASSATLQFAQAMASGKLSGDEFRSLAEASPRFMQALAEGMNAPIESLKKMSTEGKLTADVVGNALLKSLSSMRVEAEKLPDTFGGAVRRMRNEFEALVGSSTLVRNALDGLIGLVNALATNLSLVVNVLGAVGAAFAAIKFAQIAVGITTALTAAGGIATAFTGIIALLSGPIGLIALVIALAGAWFLLKNRQDEAAESSQAAIRTQIEAVKKQIDIERSNRTGALPNSGNLRAESLSDQRLKELEDKLAGLEMQAENQRLANRNNVLGGGSAFVELTPRIKELSAEQLKAAEAAAKLRASLLDQVTALELNSDGADKLSAAQKLMLKVGEALRDNKVSLTDAEKKSIFTRLQEVHATEQAAEKQKDLKKIVDDYGKSVQDGLDKQEQRVKGLDEEIKQQEVANKAVGAGQQSMLMLSNAKYDEAIASAERKRNLLLESGLDDALVKLYDDEIDRLKTLRDLKGEHIIKEAHVKAAEKVREDWKKAAEGIENSLTDALMRAFESGKDFGAALKDTLINMFKSLVLRPLIQPVASGLAATALGWLGAPQSAIASTGAGASSLFSGATGILGSIGSFGSGITSGLLGKGSIASVMGLWEGGFTSAAIGQGIGMALPWIGAAFALYSLFGKSKGGPKVGGSFETSPFTSGDRWVTSAGKLFSETQMDSDARDAAQSFYRAFSATAATFGATGALDYGFGFARDPRGDAPHRTAGFIGSAYFNRPDIERTDEALQQAIAETFSRMTLAGLQQSDLDQAFSEYFSQFDAATIDPALIQGIVDVALQAKRMADETSLLGGVFVQLADISVQARANILDLTGGLDSFMQKVAGYVSSFYTQEEQAAIQAASIAGALVGAGLDITGLDTKEEFRAMVDSLDLSTETGQQQLATLLNVAGNFATLTGYMNEQGITLEELAKMAPVDRLTQITISGQSTQQDQLNAVNNSIITIGPAIADMGEKVASAVSNAVAAVGNRPVEVTVRIDQSQINGGLIGGGA